MAMTKRIFASLSHSLIRPCPGAFIAVDSRRGGGGRDGPDGARTDVGRPRKRAWPAGQWAKQGCPPAMSADDRTRSARRPGRTRAGTPPPTRNRRSASAFGAPGHHTDRAQAGLYRGRAKGGRAAWELSDAAISPTRRVTNCVTTGPHTGASQRTLTDAVLPPTCSDGQDRLSLTLLRDEEVAHARAVAESTSERPS